MNPTNQVHSTGKIEWESPAKLGSTPFDHYPKNVESTSEKSSVCRAVVCCESDAGKTAVAIEVIAANEALSLGRGSSCATLWTLCKL